MQSTFHSATTPQILQPLGTLPVQSMNKQGSDLQIYPLELSRRFFTVKSAATLRHPAAVMNDVKIYKFTNFIHTELLAQSV